MKRSAMLREFRATLLTYVREDEGGIEISDSREETATEMSGLTIEQLVVVEAYDLAAIFSVALATVEVSDATVVEFADTKFTVRNGHPTISMIERFKGSESGVKILQRVWTCLDWGRSQPDLAPLLYGFKSKKRRNT